MRLLILIAISALSISGISHADDSTVLLVSLDGFRWDYAERTDTPNLDRIAAEGVHAESLTPVFPTKTFPNHYSQVTGLRPEHHGIVSNTMYDPEMGATFSFRIAADVQDGRWWEGEPIWVTAAKQGLPTATYFWPGSEAVIRGHQATYWKAWDGNIPISERISTVFEWLDMPVAKRPRFISLYIGDVDKVGHHFGPESKEALAAVRKVDAYIGRLLGGLDKRGLRDSVNLMVVSDHGMAQTPLTNQIDLSQHVNLSGMTILDTGAFLSVRGDNQAIQALFHKLDGAHPHLNVYLKSQVPTRLRYSGHRRIADLIGIPDPGWLVFPSRKTKADLGSHGYDNTAPSMQGIFYAVGPAFKQGLISKPFECIHLYSLMARILNLDPAPNDGNLDTVEHLLRRSAIVVE